MDSVEKSLIDKQVYQVYLFKRYPLKNQQHNHAGKYQDISLSLSGKYHQSIPATVDGRSPAPVEMENLPLFTGFCTCQLVQDFFIQRYVRVKLTELSNKINLVP